VDAGFGKEGDESVHKALSVAIVIENDAPFDSANDYVLEQTGNVKSGQTRHGEKVALHCKMSIEK